MSYTQSNLDNGEKILDEPNSSNEVLNIINEVSGLDFSSSSKKSDQIQVKYIFSPSNNLCLTKWSIKIEGFKGAKNIIRNTLLNKPGKISKVNSEKTCWLN